MDSAMHLLNNWDQKNSSEILTKKPNPIVLFTNYCNGNKISIINESTAEIKSLFLGVKAFEKNEGVVYLSMHWQYQVENLSNTYTASFSLFGPHRICK